jgi:hypothetical protein
VRGEKWARKDSGLFAAECFHFNLSFGLKTGRCMGRRNPRETDSAMRGWVLAKLQGDRVSGQQAMEEGAADFLV